MVLNCWSADSWGSTTNKFKGFVQKFLIVKGFTTDVLANSVWMKEHFFLHIFLM